MGYTMLYPYVHWAFSASAPMFHDSPMDCWWISRGSKSFSRQLRPRPPAKWSSQLRPAMDALCKIPKDTPDLRLAPRTSKNIHELHGDLFKTGPKKCAEDFFQRGMAQTNLPEVAAARKSTKLRVSPKDCTNWPGISAGIASAQ